MEGCWSISRENNDVGARISIYLLLYKKFLEEWYNSAKASATYARIQYMKLSGTCAVNKQVLLASLVFGLTLLCQAGDGRCENNEFTPEALRFAYSSKFINDVSIGDAQVAIELWTRELIRNTALKMKPKPLIYDHLQSIVKALNNKEVDIIALTPMDYLKIRDKVPLEPALLGSRRNAIDGDELVLLVRRDQGIRDINQLKGKRLMVYPGPIADSAYLWLNNILAQRNLPDHERFFGSGKEVNKPSRAVLPVFFRQADACLVIRGAFETMVELNPQIGKELMVLSNSDKLLYAVLCFHKYLNAEVKKSIMKRAFSLHTTPAGKQILTLFHIDSIVPFNPSVLDTSVALIDKRNHQDGGLLVKKQK